MVYILSTFEIMFV
uniref:Uncharacterized protein n=1 Tax=Arundo donax TaxID=35708 RepID=A0A0A9B985_ARUDO